VALAFCFFSFSPEASVYSTFYFDSLGGFEQELLQLSGKIKTANLSSPAEKERIAAEIASARAKLKNIDIWLRYFEPIAYKKINGPLPVEWESEVFEKFEKPYRREGAGLTLAELYLQEPTTDRDSLDNLINLAIGALKPYRADSITGNLHSYHHFFLANRLHLLNLAALYTTGFECPEPKNVIPELRSMSAGVKQIYLKFNEAFPATPLTAAYMELYDKMATYINKQPNDHTQFDHFTFIKDYVNPLFAINQELIVKYKVKSNSFNDYTLNNNCRSIFEKSLFAGQNAKGIFSLVKDQEAISEIKAMGKLLFYDPILSGNNERSCASCHKPTQYFTDTVLATSPQFDKNLSLPRNTPSLINVIFNHLLMLDGKHISLQGQGKDVMTNAVEMGGAEKNIVDKVTSCKTYKKTFNKLLKYTPEESEVTMSHIVSAITYYYSEFSYYYSPFDDAMNHGKPITEEAKRGFNLFMGKAQCGTCHFVPHFSGVKPPYVGSEFEVLGVPADPAFKQLSNDKGRYVVNAADETFGAFRTGTVRNAEYTKPYMHNGVFKTLEEVIDFYDAGGGAGRNLAIKNQTLSADSLKLTQTEKRELLLFIKALNENIVFQSPPAELPASNKKECNNRKPGGIY
jgi:cytochrome c peroxidase